MGLVWARCQHWWRKDRALAWKFPVKLHKMMRIPQEAIEGEL